MPDLAREPSMEDILASIKRIIAEDGAVPPPPPPRVRRGPAEVPPAAADEVLELTDPVSPPVAESCPAPVPAPVMEQPAAPPPRAAATVPEPEPAAAIVSEQAACASRQSLASLSAMLVTPAAGQDNTLDGLVRDLLRPMLKAWLDARLPELVEGLVAKEIARIAGRAL